MVCRQSIITGIICIIISTLAVVLKYKMIKNRQVYQKKTNEAESRYNATFIDFIQNIIAVRKLNIGDFCNKKIDGLPYLLFYMSALTKLYSNLNSLVRLLDINERFKTAKKQLDEYFNNVSDIQLIDDFKNVKLKDIIFSYSRNSTKIKISEFTLNKGDKISIMGESGQGKTTVVNILAELYPLENGEMLIDNRPITDGRLDLYFFDEPTSNLDILSEEKIANMIERYLREKTYVIVTHRPRVKELCNKHYVFEEHMMKEVVKV